MKYLTPVIHVKDQEQALRNADICAQAGTKGFFLINHRIPCRELAEIAAVVRNRFPKAWIGINILDEHPLTAIPQLPPIDGFWTDDPCLIEGQPTQDLAESIRKSLKHHHPTALYLGSVSFKYQPQPRNLKAMTQLACKYMDIITTSGEGTGIAADTLKAKEMHLAAGNKPLAIASGITAENIGDYLPYITWFLVATGISIDFYNLNPVLVARLPERIPRQVKIL